MGIDADRFVYSIPQDCFCIICSLVLEDPVELIICGHHFCYQCFEQWSLEQHQKQELQEEIECPYCGIYADVTGVRKDKLAWNLIQNYNIYCENKKNGCESVYKLGFQDLHECEYKNKTLEEKEEEDVEKCSLCNLTFLENHDCLRELIKISKQKSIEITNLQHENNRLICKLTKREKEFVENLTLMESQYQDDNLKYNKEIRELRTRLAAMQGELGSKTGQSEVYTLNINLERLNGSLGFNIIGGTTENEKTSSGIFISRITEGGAADQPGKLQLHDRIIEVDGVSLSEATHELAVKTFRNSGDPVKMVIQRQIYKNKSCEAGTQTFGVIFAVTGDDACDKVINNQDEVKNIKNNNKPSRWINPQELINSIHITKTDDEDDYIQNTDQIIKNKDQLTKEKDENNIIDDYDSAYDTLVTQKSSRNSRLSSDVESCSTNTQTPTLPEDSDSQGVILRNNKNHSNSENRLSTFYVIPGDEKSKEIDTSLLHDFVTPQKIEGDFEEYEYEEVSLSKTTDEKYGLLLCYGGDENDVAVYVGDIEDSSVADISGKIMVGDQIVRINDNRIRNVDEAYSLLQSNNKIILVVARAVYEPQTDYYDDAEETDLDMIDDIDDILPTLSLPMHATNNIIQEEEENEDQNIHEDDKKTDQVTDNQSTTSSSNDSAFIGLQRTKSLSPVTRSPVDFDLLRGRSSSVNDHHKIVKEKIPSIALSSVPRQKVEKESKYSLKNLRHKLGSHSSDKKDKRPNSHSDDSTELYKLPRCDSNSSNSSARSKRSSSKENKSEVTPNDVSKAKVNEQRQLSRMKAYLDSPSVIRHRINNNMLIKPTAQVKPPTNINANEHSPYPINGIPHVAPQVASHVTPQVAPHMTSPPQHPVMRTPHPNIIYNNPVRSSLSESVLRSAMKPMNGKVRQPKHVQIDSHPNWNETEKRVWEEFKIIQSMEAKENLTNIQQNNNVINNVEAEWRVRRSKDGKHIYIKKSNSTRNRVLKDREEQIQEERCGMTTDDDAFTVYQGQYWNKDQRKRQLSRHNERRKKLLQKAEAKQLYENKNERVINEMAQRNMFLPGNTVFDNYITVEEILSQRNRSGFLDGPVHVTTI